MAIIAATGFDSLPSSGIPEYLNQTGFPGTVGGGRVTGRNGVGYALGVGSSTFVLAQNLNLPQGCFGFAAITPPSFGGVPVIMDDVNGAQLFLSFNSGAVTVPMSYNPTGTANDITTDIPVIAGTGVYNFYEIRWTSSLIEVAVNNQVVYTKVQTAQPAFRKFFTQTSSFPTMTLDDMYLADDATFRGDMYIRALTFTGTASNTGAVVGAADAHTALSSFDGDTSYVNYTADGQKTLLDLADITDNPSTIHAVMIARQARKSDTGSVTESLLINTASEQTVGGPFAGFPLSYSGRRLTITSDPHDASAWTKTKINAMQIGVKRGV